MKIFKFVISVLGIIIGILLILNPTKPIELLVGISALFLGITGFVLTAIENG